MIELNWDVTFAIIEIEISVHAILLGINVILKPYSYDGLYYICCSVKVRTKIQSGRHRKQRISILVRYW